MQRWQIVNAGENLFRPLLMRVTSEGVGKGIPEIMQSLS